VTVWEAGGLWWKGLMVLVLGAYSPPRKLLTCHVNAPLLAARTTITRAQVCEETMLYNATLTMRNLSSLKCRLLCLA
jgi:hypothetical protein